MVLEDHRSLRERKQVATVNMEGTGETLETEIVHERSIDGQGIRVTKVDHKEGPGKMAKDNEVESGTTKSVTSEAWNEDKMVADICKTIVKNHITKVSIMFDKTKYVRTEKNLRVTFADQLSNLGMI